MKLTDILDVMVVRVNTEEYKMFRDGLIEWGRSCIKSQLLGMLPQEAEVHDDFIDIGVGNLPMTDVYSSAWNECRAEMECKIKEFCEKKVKDETEK